ncbi:MAG: chemotaxis-specific protein-glutamate methyltransferase CheB [Polyangiaceae bacterium]
MNLSTRRIRILVVDDSVVVRRLVAQALSLQPDMEVTGCAENGLEALARVAADRPDAVVLDLEMPGIGGLEALRELKKRHNDLPVLVFSSHTTQGAQATVDALLAGADEFATKPANLGPSSSQWLAVQTELALKLRAVTRRARRVELARTTQLASERPPLASARARARVRAVAIGTSSGGPEALAALLPRFSAALKVPLLIVQHMPRSFTAALAARLHDKSALRVTEAVHGQLIEPGVAYLAPGDRHMQVANRAGKLCLLLDEGPLENGCRPSVDPLFRSAAEAYGTGLLAVVLTGIGSDGVEGARRVVANAGHVWVQDEESSAVWGMPGAVSRAGLARRTCSLGSMASAIEAAVTDGLPAHYPADAGAL